MFRVLDLADCLARRILGRPAFTPTTHQNLPRSFPPRSIVRDALVNVMVSGATSQRAKPSQSAPPPPPPAAALVAVEDGHELVESNGQVDGCWSKVAASPGGRELPRDASTCLLWCAIALGALVRGCPLTQVGGYGPDLACFDGSRGGFLGSLAQSSSRRCPCCCYCRCRTANEVGRLNAQSLSTP